MVRGGIFAGSQSLPDFHWPGHVSLRGIAGNDTRQGAIGLQRTDRSINRLLKNYLRCHCCVKKRLVRESDQNAHLQLVKSSATPTVFRLFLPALAASPTFFNGLLKAANQFACC